VSKGKSPAFQFYPSDYLSDINVQLMTMEEEGCYIRLLSYCWQEGDLPSDLDALKQLCKGVIPSVRVVTCFCKVGDKLRHSRLDKERKKQRDWVTKSREAGYKSAAKRWGYKRNSQVANLTEMLTPNGNQSGNQMVTLQSSSSNTPLPPKRGELLVLFDLFWQHYPRHESRQTAFRAFSRIHPNRELVESWVLWLEKAKLSRQWQDTNYIPHLSVWLNQRRWESDPPPGMETAAPGAQRVMYDDDLPAREVKA